MNKLNLQPLLTPNQLLVEFYSFWRFFPSTYKTAMIHTLLYLCFPICSDLTKFHLELVKLMDVFKSNGFSENFINNYLNVLLDNKHRIHEKVTNVTKKPLFLVLPYLGPLSFQSRTTLRKSFKDILNCYKLQIVFKS